MAADLFAFACPVCAAPAGQPCRWGMGLTLYYGAKANEHVHFSRPTLSA